MDVVERLKSFIENETRSCSMDFGGITPIIPLSLSVKRVPSCRMRRKEY